MTGIRVVDPGLLTTVQDLGRIGHQREGMVVAGAMDPISLQMANILVGNPRDTASLEITLLGPKLEFTIDTVIAITGADLQPRIDGQPVPTWCGLAVKKGNILEFGGIKSGCRSYLAISGGFELAQVMGSSSTYLRGQLGGFQGRALQKGDFLPIKSPIIDPISFRPRWYFNQPVYSREKEVRVIRGPEFERFTPAGITTFYSAKYEVTSLSDRMGYRLKGPKIESQAGSDIISDAIPFGGIQVPADGMPIILMADRQTTGGYTRIGTVISVDLPLISQSKPGDLLRFCQVSVEEAQELYLQMEKVLESLSEDRLFS